jgi:transcriptional regulator with XRE-family HTH domain
MTEPLTTTSLRHACVEHLKAARKSAKLSQSEVAEAVGMERTYYAKVERGVTNVSLETLDKLRHFLVVTVPALPNLSQQVADRIRNARGVEFSQERLGKEAGLSVAYVGRLERRETAVSIDQVEAIAKVLDIDPLNFVTI